MNEWTRELSEVAGLVLRAGSTTEMLVLAVIAIVVCAGALNLFGSHFGLSSMTLGRAFAFLLPTVVLALAAVIAARLYALPQVSSRVVGIGLQVACPVVVVLIMLAVLAALAKGPYPQCLATAVAALVVATLVTMAVRFGWRSVIQTRSWAEDSGTSVERTQ